VIRISNEQSRFEHPLEQLIRELQALLSVAERGEWDRIEELAPTILSSMEAFSNTTRVGGPVAYNRNQLQNVQQMLETAILMCSSRQEQIRELVNALKITQASTGTP
jgi:hypothetical protein